MTTYTDLNAFQRDLLWALAGIEPAYGLEIKESLEAHGYDKVHHGRMYPNLDDLADDGLIEKGTLDARTNSYKLTEDARRMLQRRLIWEQQQSGDDQ